MSQDPVFLGTPNQQVMSDPQSLNAYAYSDDNPITKSDPNGRADIDFNAVYATPSFFGPSADYYYVPGGDNSDPYISLGITVSRPGPSGGVTYSPNGTPPNGWNVSGGLFSGFGGAQFSPNTHGISVAPGYAYPRGVSLTIGYSMKASQWSELIGGPFQDITTPMNSLASANSYLQNNVITRLPSQNRPSPSVGNSYSVGGYQTTGSAALSTASLSISAASQAISAGNYSAAISYLSSAIAALGSASQ